MPSQSDLESFLSGTPLNYNNTNTRCDRRLVRLPLARALRRRVQGLHSTRSASPRATIICLPPTPTYDDFVKWGQAKANYPLLSSPSYLSTAKSIAIGLGIALPLAAARCYASPSCSRPCRSPRRRPRRHGSLQFAAQ